MKEISNNKIQFSQRFICPIDWKLNKILKKCLKHEIRRVYKKGHLFLEVEFSDMTHYEFWNCDRFDGWLMYGRFWRIFDSEDNCLYRYSGKRPTRRTMQRFLNKIKKYYDEKANKLIERSKKYHDNWYLKNFYYKEIGELPVLELKDLI